MGKKLAPALLKTLEVYAVNVHFAHYYYRLSLDFVLVATLSTFNHDLHSAATTTATTQITLPQTTLQTFKAKKIYNQQRSKQNKNLARQDQILAKIKKIEVESIRPTNCACAKPSPTKLTTINNE